MYMDDALTKKECAKAAKAIKPLAKKRFPEARIVRVEVTGSDDSYDNHPLVWVRVVVDTPEDAMLDVRSMIDFERDLGPALEEIGIFATPIPSYDSYSEVGDAA